MPRGAAFLSAVGLIRWENSYSISFQIEWDVIVVTVFFSILKQMELHSVQNRKENCSFKHNPSYTYEGLSMQSNILPANNSIKNLILLTNLKKKFLNNSYHQM